MITWNWEEEQVWEKALSPVGNVRGVQNLLMAKAGGWSSGDRFSIHQLVDCCGNLGTDEFVQGRRVKKTAKRMELWASRVFHRHIQPE